MKEKLAILIAVAGLAGAALAEPQTFDFKDPKGVNNAAFKLDAPLEAINGNANGVSGTVVFEPAKPEATRGRIVVTSSSLHVPNPIMKEHLHSEQWMDVARYPDIRFEARHLKNVRTDGNSIAAEAEGTFTLRGVAREMTIPVRLTYLKDKLGARSNGQMQGDLLVIRANFSIRRSDFGINPKAPEEKVAETIDLTLSIAGAAPR